MPDFMCQHGSGIQLSTLTVLPSHQGSVMEPKCATCAYQRGLQDGIDAAQLGMDAAQFAATEGRSEAPTGYPDHMPPRNDSRKMAWDFCEREHGIFESCPFCDMLTARIERARREDIALATRPMELITRHPGFESIIEQPNGYTVTIRLSDGDAHTWTGGTSLLWKQVYDDLVRWKEDKVRGV